MTKYGLLHDKLSEIVDYGYSGETKMAMMAVSNLMPELIAFVSSVEKEIGAQQLMAALQLMLLAIEEQDGTQLADVITYELLPLIP